MTVTVSGVLETDYFEEDRGQLYPFTEEGLVGVDVDVDSGGESYSFRLLNHADGNFPILYEESDFCCNQDVVLEAIIEFLGCSALFGDIEKYGYLSEDPSTGISFGSVRDATDRDWNRLEEPGERVYHLLDNLTEPIAV